MAAFKPRWFGSRIVPNVLACLLAACTVGPDFQPPQDPPQTRYTAPDEASSADAGPRAANQSIGSAEKISNEWWAMFQSPQLDAVVRQAVAGNFTLKSAEARRAQAQQAIASAESALYPQVDLSADVSRGKLTATSFGLSPSTFPLPPNFNLFQISPSLSYTLSVLLSVIPSTYPAARDGKSSCSQHWRRYSAISLTPPICP